MTDYNHYFTIQREHSSKIHIIQLMIFLIFIGFIVFAVIRGNFFVKSAPPVTVNLQVTEYKNPNALKKVMDELKSKGIKKATIFVGGEFTKNNCPLVKQYDKEGYEIAAFGYALDDKGNFVQLTTLSKDKQEEIIKNTKENIEKCISHPISGFRAQRFSQDDDTNQIVKELGFAWNGSFVSGSSYLTEKKDANVPYLSSKYGFYAVPMIGVQVKPGAISALCDAALSGVVQNPSQWKDTVKQYFQKRAQNNLPFITEFHPYLLVTSSGWWNNFMQLLDWLRDQKPNFVTTNELIKNCNPPACSE